MVGSGGGGGPVRDRARGRGNAVAWGARGSKASRRATAEHALRPGGALRMRAGAGDAGSTRGGMGSGGATWKKQEWPVRGWEGGGEAEEGTWTGAERRWGGGGAAHGRQSGGGARAEKQRRERGGRRRRTHLQISERIGTPL
jgi:hypothetical protein